MVHFPAEKCWVDYLIKILQGGKLLVFRDKRSRELQQYKDGSTQECIGI